MTRDWWRRRRASFACLASQEVVIEAVRGDSEQVQHRLAVLTTLPRASVSADIQEAARLFLAAGCLPPKAAGEATLALKEEVPPPSTDRKQ